MDLNLLGLFELSPSAMGEMGLKSSFAGGEAVVDRFAAGDPPGRALGEVAEAGLGRKPGVDDLDWKMPRDRRLDDDDAAELTFRVIGEAGSSPRLLAGSSTGDAGEPYISCSKGSDCDGSDAAWSISVLPPA